MLCSFKSEYGSVWDWSETVDTLLIPTMECEQGKAYQLMLRGEQGIGYGGGSR